jgi:hypothetical protein
MEGHIHLSAISVLTTAAICVLTVFFLHMAALKLSNSDSASAQAWGKAFGVGWG